VILSFDRILWAGGPGTSEGFQHLMTRIAGGHPILDANTLEQEAYKNLGMLLDQLQSPETPSLSGLVAFAIINR
jgi:hypothetical protein